MKIAISSTGSDLGSFIDPRFGRCSYFLILDEKGKLIKSIPNEGGGAIRGAGITAAQIVANERVNVVITGNIGPNAFLVLNQTGIEIYIGATGISCKQAFEKYKEGKLIKASAPAPPFGSRERGFGRCRRGRRR